MRSTLLCCILLALLSYSHGKLVVKYPDMLKGNFDALNGIDYTVLTPQNKNTYKRAFIGTLALTNPSDACAPIASISDLSKEAVYNPILLVDWGECHYAQKVKNAENAGAKMILIILRHDMQFNHPAVRPLGINTNIEVLAVSHTDGQVLLDYIQAARGRGEDSNIELVYSYEIERHVNYQNTKNVMVDFWYSSGDISQASYEFLESFGELLSEFGDALSFNPHYVLWECDECKNDPRCISDGRYCDPEPLKPNKLPGREAVLEDLRQICFRELNPNTTLDNDWWTYVTSFGRDCVDKDMNELQECRTNLLNNVDGKIRNQVEECIKANQGEVSHFTRELQQQEAMHIDHYPALYVNKEKYPGSFRNRYAVREFICSHFMQDTLPESCISPVNAAQEMVYTSSDVGIYIGMIVLSIVVMIVMIYCVRRSVKRQVMFRMNDEISHIVTQYKQFKDKSNSFSIDEDT